MTKRSDCASKLNKHRVDQKCCQTHLSIAICLAQRALHRQALWRWVRPAEWEGEPEDRPIRQLEVKVSNYLGQDPVRGSTAVSAIEQPCKPRIDAPVLSG